MKVWSDFAKVALICAVAGLSVAGWAPGARAQQAIDPDAQSVLDAMANYLGGLKSFSVEYSTVDEVVTPAGQKLQFLHSGRIIVQRPGELYATRGGPAGVSELFLNGKGLSIYSKQFNAYLQVDTSNIMGAIEAVRNLGLEAPGADLLTPKPLDNPTTDIVSGAYIGESFIDGIKVHQLAFRGANVDWQLWVTDGDRPLPLRYVITTKWLTGAPQYTVQLKNWNTAPQIDAAQFTFVPPQGARKLDPAAVAVNAVGDLTIKGK
jgi:hypothetical protein